MGSNFSRKAVESAKNALENLSAPGVLARGKFLKSWALPRPGYRFNFFR